MTVEQQLSVNARVEDFRERLGLRPWALFAKEQLECHRITSSPEYVRMHPQRQTGRTTYALMLGIAKAIETGEPLVLMGASDNHALLLRDRAQVIMGQLGIEVPILLVKRGVVVRDHLADEIAEITG